MKKIIKLSEEIIPLSRKQAFFLFIIISCLFQFVLFYTPALAEDAINKVNKEKGFEEDILVMMSLSKSKNFSSLKESVDVRPLNSPQVNNVENFDNSEVVNDLFKDELNDEFLKKKIAFVKEEPKGPDIVVTRSSVHSMTAYNSEVGQTDDSPCITANGFNVCSHGIEDTIAANFLKFGTKVRIPDLFGDRIFIVRDRMNKRYSERVDVWMLNRADALKFGVRKARIEVVEIIEPEEIKKEDKILLTLS